MSASIRQLESERNQVLDQLREEQHERQAAQDKLHQLQHELAFQGQYIASAGYTAVTGYKQMAQSPDFYKLFNLTFFKKKILNLGENLLSL